MTSGFSANGEDAITRQLACQDLFDSSSSHINQTEETLQEAYEIHRCPSWIKEINAKKVTLQFPDELLVDAPDVALDIERKSAVEVYILGDTSYGR